MDIAEMDAVMQERIEKFNQYVMSKDIDKMPIGLFSGKMGICIYFYHQARYSENKDYKKFADKLLESLYSQLSTKSLVNLEDGFIGVCLGLNYLVENGFQKGNINHVLPELDDKIFKTAWFELIEDYSNPNEAMKSVFETAFYFSIRLQNTKLNKNNRFLFESIVIKAINFIESTFNYTDKFFEPLSYSLNEYFLANYFYLLTFVYQLGFYNYKLDKIIDEIFPKLVTTYPLLQSNRIQLIAALEYLNAEFQRKCIDIYIARLRRDIDYTQMVTYEFRNKNLLLANGLCGMYLVQNIFFKKTELPNSLILNKIIQSELWDNIYIDDVKLNTATGLFTGLAGIVLIYQDLIKNTIL